MSEAPLLTHGPLLGAVAAEGVKVWIRTDRPASWSVRAWPKGDDEHGASSIEVRGPPLMAAADFTGSTQLTGLTPRTRYEYTVSIRAQFDLDTLAYAAAHAEFHTLVPDGEPARTRVLVVGTRMTAR